MDMAMADTATMARGRRPLDTTIGTMAMADTVDMADTDVVMAMAKERQSQAITVVAIMDTVATEAMVEDMVDTGDMVDMAMASERLMLRLAITMVIIRVTMVGMEDMAMDIMARPTLVQEFSA